MFNGNTYEQSTHPEMYKNIHFVESPPILRQIGETPPEIIEQGFDPKTSEQIAIFGDEESLFRYKTELGLNDTEYPIHRAKMGTHIDIYNKNLIKKIKLNNPVITAREYWKEKKNSEKKV